MGHSPESMVGHQHWREATPVCEQSHAWLYYKTVSASGGQTHVPSLAPAGQG